MSKLLSHRARGFGAPEHSAPALRSALVSGVPWIEVDTRASADGTLFLHHDATLKDASGRRVRVAAHSGADLQGRLASPLLTLPSALDLLKRHGGAGQRLCLDIKDFGFEAEHLDAVRRAGLEGSVVWVSWIPQTLARLAELGTTAPLMLSHTNLLQFPLLAWLARPWRRSVRRWGPIVLQGHARHSTPLERWRHGYQHSLVCDELPHGLAEMLAASGGGVCLHHMLGGPRVGEFCHRRGLRLWLFTARDTQHFMRLAAREDVDVVFSDDAASVLSAARAAEAA